LSTGVHFGIWLIVGCAAALYSASTIAAEPGRTTTAKKPSPAASPPKPASAPSASRERQQLQSEQEELKRELAKLKRQLMATEASRADAADGLAASEVAISSANRRLRELFDARRSVEQQIAGLQERSRAVAASELHQRQLSTEALRRQYLLTLHDPLHVWVAGGNPGDAVRDATYFDYLIKATTARVSELQQRGAELSELEELSRQKRAELSKISADEEKSRAHLLAEQTRRKRSLTQLSKQIASQRQSIDKLERDEKRLAALIDQLSKVLAEQARREAARKAAEAAARAERPATAPVPRPAPLEPGPGSSVANLRGKLPMPVTGEITGRFGTPRRVEGAGTAPTWKGVFIRAAPGAEVRAVAAGQVVFSDWLRGFGNLMVIDHGDSFLSVYGNNESLLRNVGERVAVGDVVAAVGNTGGNEQTGLYFELRFQGRPFDPLKWVAAR
jgi:septal ring factor EnvC (AmiA/AmiB activator)